MIALSVAKIKMFSPGSEIFLGINPKIKKKNVFCDEPTSVRQQGVIKIEPTHKTEYLPLRYNAVTQQIELIYFIITR